MRSTADWRDWRVATGETGASVVGCRQQRVFPPLSFWLVVAVLLQPDPPTGLCSSTNWSFTFRYPQNPNHFVYLLESIGSTSFSSVFLLLEFSMFRPLVSALAYALALSNPASGLKVKSAPPAAARVAAVGWQNALATSYASYPACCPNSPTYDRNADKSECDDFSGCQYLGTFAGANHVFSLNEVKSTNIVAFYDDRNQKNDGEDSPWWKKNIAGKKLQVRNPANGQQLVVTALDTCGNDDCDGCCTTNSKGGILLDFEFYTCQRLFGPNSDCDGPVQWQWATGSINSVDTEDDAVSDFGVMNWNSTYPIHEARHGDHHRTDAAEASKLKKLVKSMEKLARLEKVLERRERREEEEEEEEEQEEY